MCIKVMIGIPQIAMAGTLTGHSCGDNDNLECTRYDLLQIISV